MSDTLTPQRPPRRPPRFNPAALRLALSRTLKIYRGEGGRVTAFLILHILISLVIGMVSTVVDALTVTRSGSGGDYLLYGTSAVLLALIGIVYAGITDRSDKRRVLTRMLILSALICLAGSGLLFFAGRDGAAEWVLTGLFVWRFLVGIVLLMVFWDLAPFYFNARQGKRLFPLLAMGGAAGYSLGSLAAAGLAAAVPAGVMLLAIGGVTLLAVAWFIGIRRNFSILDSPRYRDRSIISEVREGLTVFRENPFLRAVGVNTVFFGVLAGLIVFTYNALVTARTSGATQAAGVMGYQRAIVTFLQAVVLKKVMSQSAVGGKGKSSLLQQIFFLILGAVAFAVSMVGVADFTRQIEVALMSPAAMAAFGFLPGRYRGRVMVLNNMVAVAVGILLATVFVAALAPVVPPLWFVYPIALLMVARIAFGAVLNRRYTALLSESIVADNRLNLARIEENTANFVRDEALLARLATELEQQSESVRVFVLSRLARGAESPEDIRRIEPFFTTVFTEQVEALWIETLGRIDYDQYRPRITDGTKSPFPAVRRTAQFIELSVLFRRGDEEAFSTHLKGVTAELTEAIRNRTSSDPYRFRDILDMLLRLEGETGKTVVEVEWEPLSTHQKQVFLEVLMTRPLPRFFPLLLQLLSEPDWTTAAIPAVAALPPEFLMPRRQEWSGLPAPIRLELVRAFPDPVLQREESADLLSTFLAGSDPTVEPAPADLLLQHGHMVTDTALILLSDPAPLPPGLAKRVSRAAESLTELFPELFRLRFAAEETPEERYRPLTVKATRELIDRLAALVLTFHSLNLSREDDRILAYTVCRELTERTTSVQHTTLEFIETKIAGDARLYLMTYYETMTVAEKHRRLRTVLRNTSGTLAQTAAQWQRALSSQTDRVTAEAIGLLAGPGGDCQGY